MTAATLDSVRSVRFEQYARKGVATAFVTGNSQAIPFTVGQIVTVADVPDRGTRGNSANRATADLLACLSGSIDVVVDDGEDVAYHRLSANGTGLVVPPLVWRTLVFDGPSTVLIAFREAGDDQGCVRDRGEFDALRLGLEPEVGARDAAAAREALWRDISAVSERVFGYVDEYPPYAVLYPWVAHRLRAMGGDSKLLDVGAGIGPLPLFFADRGARVVTVDRHTRVRTLPADETWSGWGFLDYGAIDERITSYNCDAVAHMPDGCYDAAYSVGMVAHMTRAGRTRLFDSLASWLLPGGRFVFTLDLVPGTDRIWNLCEGRVVEDQAVHGTVVEVVRSLVERGYRVACLRVLEDIEGSPTDHALVECVAPGEAGGRT